MFLFNFNFLIPKTFCVGVQPINIVELLKQSPKFQVNNSNFFKITFPRCPCNLVRPQTKFWSKNQKWKYDMELPETLEKNQVRQEVYPFFLFFFSFLLDSRRNTGASVAIMDHEMPLRMEATQGQIATESPHPCPAEGLTSSELTSYQTSECKKKRNVHFL